MIKDINDSNFNQSMQPTSTLNRLKESSVFKEWKKEHDEAYLVHCFVMYEGHVESEWQAGYYVPGHDRIVTFNIGHEIKISPESEIFKEDSTALKALDIDSVRVDVKKAIEEATKLQQKKYPVDKPQKTIVILQHLVEGTFYNITFVTAVFNTLNIKVDPETGEVVSDKLNSIMNMAKQEK